MVEGLSFAWLLWRVGPPNLSKPTLVLMISWLHVSWWWGPPFSSEDVWRYLWDGALWWEGAPTYLYAPSSPFFDALSPPGGELAELRARVGHAELSTIYPPGAQQLFRVTTSGGVSLTAWRASLLFAQLLSFAALGGINAPHSGAWGLAALPVLFPVWVFDCALGAHLDAWAVAFGVWGLRYTQGDRPLRAGFMFGLGASVKLIPGLWGLIVVVRYALERGAQRALSLCVGLTSALLMMSASSLHELMSFNQLTGPKSYHLRWVFNDSVFSALVASFEYIDLEVGSPRGAAQVTLGLTLICGVLFGFRGALDRERTRHEETLRVICLCTALLLIGSPVVYSWYLGWLIVGLPVRWGRSRYLWVTVAWGVMIPLSYLPRLSVLSGGPWDISPWWRVTEYLSLGLIFMIRTRYTPPQISPAHTKMIR